MEQLVEQLLERARVAKARSEKIVARAAALAASREESSRRPRRCAWCGRVSFGGRWVEEKQVPTFFKARRDPGSASHTICDECFGELRAEGRSR